MALLADLLNKYIFSGVPSNAAWDLIKAAWGKAHNKSWEALYLESFKQAVNEAEPILVKYTGGKGEIGLNEDELSNALHRDLAIDPTALSFSALSE